MKNAFKSGFNQRRSALTQSSRIIVIFVNYADWFYFEEIV